MADAGVESVRGDSNSNKLEVKGKVDPGKIQKKVKRKTKTKVKLIFPPAESEGYGDEHERGDKKLEEEKTRPDDVANTAENEGYGDEHERGDKKFTKKNNHLLQRSCNLPSISLTNCSTLLRLSQVCMIKKKVTNS
jgi:hypothetical protein